MKLAWPDKENPLETYKDIINDSHYNHSDISASGIRQEKKESNIRKKGVKTVLS